MAPRLAGGALLRPADEPLRPEALDERRRRRCARASTRPRRLGRRAEVPGRRPSIELAAAPAARRRWRCCTLRVDGERRDLRPGRRRLRTATASTRPGRSRTSRRCSTTTRCWPARTSTAGRCSGDPVLRRDGRGDARVGAARDAPPRGRLLQRPGRRHRGRRGQVLRVDASTSCATCSAPTPTRRSPGSARPRRGNFREGPPGANVLDVARARARRGHPRARSAPRCWPRATARPARARRQAPDEPGTRS